jgi:hypothetical protein
MLIPRPETNFGHRPKSEIEILDYPARIRVLDIRISALINSGYLKFELRIGLSKILISDIQN